MIDRRFTTALAASAGEVWEVVSTRDGVNAELGPWLRMTHPVGIGSLEQEGPGTGAVLFHSWLLLGGIVPFDRHALGLERVLPGEGFDEESTSWMQRRWRHERRVEPTPTRGCTVTDHLVVVPRVGLLRPVVDRVVSAVFDHRHRRLVRRFGPG